jgi:hypothetical protein
MSNVGPTCALMGLAPYRKDRAAFSAPPRRST